MKPSLLLRIALIVATPALALAHPGHDGHELVWEVAGTHVHLDWIIASLLGAAFVVCLYRYVKKRS